MESAELPCEKKGCLGFNWTILRPTPAVARNAARSKVMLLTSGICNDSSRMRSERSSEDPLPVKQSTHCVSLLRTIWIMEMTHYRGSDWRPHSTRIRTDQGASP